METDRVRATVKRSRNVIAFAELSHANWVIFQNAKEEREGWFYDCLAANVLAAFKFEAYLNHVGKALFPHSWNKMERLSHARKRDAVCERLGIVRADDDSRWRTVADLFKFRNMVAHGKSEVLDPPEAVEEGEIEELRRKRPLTQWEELCTTEFAKRAYEDTESIMKEMHSAASLDEDDFRRSGHSYTISNREKIA